MKDLYDAVREAIQRDLAGIISFEDDKLEDKRKERAATRSSKRKRVTDEQPSKKFKEAVELRTDTVDELRNYLRVVDFENPKMKEDSDKKSKISTFSVVESKEGDYLIFHRQDGSFRVFNSL